MNWACRARSSSMLFTFGDFIGREVAYFEVEVASERGVILTIFGEDWTTVVLLGFVGEFRSLLCCAAASAANVAGGGAPLVAEGELLSDAMDGRKESFRFTVVNAATVVSFGSRIS